MRFVVEEIFSANDTENRIVIKLPIIRAVIGWRTNIVKSFLTVSTDFVADVITHLAAVLP
jgi:hypothetical protein